jgi:chromosome partitioning protein
VGDVIACANQKGGVGKTTTVVNLAAYLALENRRVLVVDLDPQGNATSGIGFDRSIAHSSIYPALTEGVDVRELVKQTAIEKLALVPSERDLAGAEVELVGLAERERRLRRALVAAREEFDYTLLDCPPAVGLLTVNALVAADSVLVPIQCEYYALEGLTQLLRTIEEIRDLLNPTLRVGAILLTMYDARTRLASGVADEVRSHFADVVLQTTIPRSVRISEAPSYGQTVLTYDAGSAGAMCYLQAARELADQVEEVAS